MPSLALSLDDGAFHMNSMFRRPHLQFMSAQAMDFSVTAQWRHSGIAFGPPAPPPPALCPH